MSTTPTRHGRRAGRAAATILASSAVLAGGIVTAPAAQAVAKYTCRGHRATIVGTKHADHLHGTRHRDVIYAGSGNDRVDGGGGDDLVCGGSGADVLTGGRGKDRLLGGTGNDRLVAGARDYADGQDGNDSVRVAGNDAHGVGGAGNDRLVADHDRDSLSGGSGNDSLDGGRGTGGLLVDQAGNDRITVTGRHTYVLGGDGNDTITVGGPDTLVHAGPGNDTVTGSRYGDLLDGEDGKDRIRGGAGDDLLTGGKGDDRLYGEGGSDHCVGNLGIDTCDGGSPGMTANTAADPDKCDAERLISCYGLPEEYVGTASGKLSSGGLNETWSATYSLQQRWQGNYYGTGTITWSVSGTDANGCSYSGGATLEAHANLAIFEPLGQYSADVYPAREADTMVTQSCPLTGTQQVRYEPLDTDAASTPLVRLPADPGDLAGTRTYHPNRVKGVTASWQWHEVGA